MERILTLHPQEGKQGVNITRQRYETTRQAILDAFGVCDEITFRELVQSVRSRLQRRFDGSIS